MTKQKRNQKPLTPVKRVEELRRAEPLPPFVPFHLCPACEKDYKEIVNRKCSKCEIPLYIDKQAWIHGPGYHWSSQEQNWAPVCFEIWSGRSFYGYPVRIGDPFAFPFDFSETIIVEQYLLRRTPMTRRSADFESTEHSADHPQNCSLPVRYKELRHFDFPGMCDP